MFIYPLDKVTVWAPWHSA